MKLLLSIYQNKFSRIIKYYLLIIFIFILGFKANTEIPEKYKIETSLPNCEGTDYTKWTNCYGHHKFPRIEYKGEWKEGNFDGQGILKEAWGDIYIGGFKKNKAHGFGRQDIYIKGKIVGSFGGELKNDELNGKGYWRQDGCRWKGFFKDHLLDGEGEMECDDGYEAKGNFKMGLLHGPGSKTFEDGTRSVGNFFEGELNGTGEIFWASGSYEKGNYIIGRLNGIGRKEYANGAIYHGEWNDDSKHGNGKMVFANGDKYDGQYKFDRRDGFGKYTYANGDFYEGEWVDGRENGKGEFVWVSGDYYVGQFVDGYRTGQGTYTYESGTVIKGNFKENFAEGYGEITYSNGDNFKGELLRGYEHGQGKMVFANGDKYVGQFKDGAIHGKGKMVYANGKVVESLWENGKEAEGKTTLAKFTTDEKYYALIIGNNDYEKLEDLDNAVNDATDLEQVLREKYGFETTLLTDKKFDKTLNAIINFTKNRNKQDNILIFYAGHGQLEKKQKRGYWLPTDAGVTQDSKWISNTNIKDLIGESDAKHILLIVDSCFSGSLMRGSGKDKSVEKLTATSIKRLQVKKTRLVITSGGNEEVVDGIGGSKNSVFAEPLIRALKENTNVIRSIELFQTVQNYVINNANQTPEHSLIHGTGHNGGEFLFFPKS